MLLTSRSVADCFKTTPRAPRRMARRTSRKIAWSSATRMRIGCLFLAMSAERHLDSQPRPMARIGFHGQDSPHGAGALFDGNRAQAQTIQFIPREPARKTEPLAVVVYY